MASLESKSNVREKKKKEREKKDPALKIQRKRIETETYENTQSLKIEEPVVYIMPVWK